MVNFIAVAIAAAAIGVAGYFIFYRNKATAGGAVKPSYAPFSQWDINKTIPQNHSMNAAMTNRGAGSFEFIFPNKNGVHDVQTSAPALAVGRTISMTFAIEGDAEFAVSDPADKLPVYVRLFMQQVGDDLSAIGKYEFYRWWSNPACAEIKSGQQAVVSVPLIGDQWSSVKGKTGIQALAGFSDCINNAAGIGFTFGHDFFDHGGYAKTGTAKFVLKSYTVQ